MTTPQSVLILRSLDQMKGAVHIPDASTALYFVRLRTGWLCYLWSPRVEEIFRLSDPDSQWHGSYTEKEWGKQSGMDAVLTSTAYAVDGFSPCTVVGADDGFEITRWVCVFACGVGFRVEHWQERVMPDGGYKLTILESRPVSTLHSKHWYYIQRD